MFKMSKLTFSDGVIQLLCSMLTFRHFPVAAQVCVCVMTTLPDCESGKDLTRVCLCHDPHGYFRAEESTPVPSQAAFWHTHLGPWLLSPAQVFSSPGPDAGPPAMLVCATPAWGQGAGRWLFIGQDRTGVSLPFHFTVTLHTCSFLFFVKCPLQCGSLHFSLLIVLCFFFLCRFLCWENCVTWFSFSK